MIRSAESNGQLTIYFPLTAMPVRSEHEGAHDVLGVCRWAYCQWCMALPLSAQAAPRCAQAVPGHTNLAWASPMLPGTEISVRCIVNMLFSIPHTLHSLIA